MRLKLPKIRIKANKSNQRDPKAFGKWLFFVVGALFVVFGIRFAYISIGKHVKGYDLATLAKQRYTSSSTIQAKRGKIYDANGGTLATNTSRYTVYAIISHSYKSTSGKKLYVQNKRKMAKILAKQLGMSEKKVYQLLNPANKKTYQVQFGTKGSNLTASQMLKIKQYHLPGIKFTKTSAREYPEGNFLSQILGQTTTKVNSKTHQTSLVGTMGLESYFNKILSGENGVKSVRQDVYGYKLSSSEAGGRKVKDGGNVYTTIDEQVQNMLETTMQSVEDKTQAESLTGIVVEAKTGKILAASQRPNLTSDTPTWVNALTQTTYEPGSTMKIFALSAAINSGKFNPNKTYQSGSYSLGGGKITDWKTEGWGTITYQEAIDRSSNVGFAHIEQDMGAKTWLKYIKAFGFLKAAKVYGLGQEGSGSTTYSGSLEQANTAFGQGITVTGMQIIQALTAVANNGKMMQPYIISKVTDSNGKTIKKIKPKQIATPITSKTSKQVLNYLKGVIYNDDGTGQAYKVDGYTIAGKTGTAQIADSNGSYETGTYDYIYSFAGFAPANNPRYIVYVTMTKPKTVDQSAENTISTITTPIIKFLLDRDKSASKNSPGTIKMPNLIGKNINSAAKSLTKNNISVTTLGSGKKVTKQSVTAGERVMVKNRIFLLTGGTYQMPDVSGWSQADVNELGQLLGLKVKTSGTGFVSKQSITQGTTIKQGQTLTVTLAKK
ncbi:penicillin-binding transpeptidase domain-containing protein [uncultured Limosilactobacillus sp.]|uniref:penicillin-binding transpeptidase domain-containing protein n=1 Tax=uncultured Limosilactobacillus sp. TaxID=2837629 RepID=UPI0025E22A52|nr:penicillin-binding transpeptidase domain-containing protein [uncultured Limosilactobacillus sp.]